MNENAKEQQVILEKRRSAWSTIGKSGWSSRQVIRTRSEGKKPLRGWLYRGEIGEKLLLTLKYALRMCLHWFWFNILSLRLPQKLLILCNIYHSGRIGRRREIIRRKRFSLTNLYCRRDRQTENTFDKMYSSPLFRKPNSRKSGTKRSTLSSKGMRNYFSLHWSFECRSKKKHLTFWN